MKDTGLEQDTNAAPSRLQLVEAAFVALKASVARVEVVFAGVLVKRTEGLRVRVRVAGLPQRTRPANASRRPLRPRATSLIRASALVPREAGRNP